MANVSKNRLRMLPFIMGIISACSIFILTWLTLTLSGAAQILQILGPSYQINFWCSAICISVIGGGLVMAITCVFEFN